MVAIILIAFCLYLFWPHSRPKKAVHTQSAAPPTTQAASKPPPQPLVLTQQSASDFPRPVHDALEAQVALARRAISPGSIDAALGSQTRAAISVFQELQTLPQTGELDTNTRAQLTLDRNSSRSLADAAGACDQQQHSSTISERDRVRSMRGCFCLRESPAVSGAGWASSSLLLQVGSPTNGKSPVL